MDELLLTYGFGQLLMGALSFQLVAALVAFFAKRMWIAVFGYAVLAAAVAAACTSLAMPPPMGNLAAFVLAMLTGYFGYVLTMKSITTGLKSEQKRTG